MLGAALAASLLGAAAMVDMAAALVVTVNLHLAKAALVATVAVIVVGILISNGIAAPVTVTVTSETAGTIELDGVPVEFASPADAVAHGIWLTREAFEKRFRYQPKKGRVYSETKSLAQAAPDRVPAACFGSVANLTVSGQDPARGGGGALWRKQILPAHRGGQRRIPLGLRLPQIVSHWCAPQRRFV